MIKAIKTSFKYTFSNKTQTILIILRFNIIFDL